MESFDSLTSALGLAVVVGLTHTLLGPDHYIPFVVLQKARAWSLKRTLATTALCGAGHCFSSVVIAVLAVWLGREATAFDALQDQRDVLAAWLMIVFGLVLFLVERRTQASSSRFSAASCFWWIFVVFVLGPCEWLIPASVLAGSQYGPSGVALVCLAFSAATMATMLSAVFLLSRGGTWLSEGFWRTWGSAVAAGSMVLCGVLILI